MLAELKEGTMVRGCLSNAKKLKTVDDWKKVFITPDLDKQERLRNKELREELWRRRKDGEENLIIHKGKIVDKKRPTLKHFLTEDTKVKLGLQDWLLCSNSRSNENINNNCKTYNGKRKNKGSNIDKISCLYLNARSVINKRDELELYIIENKPSIIGVTDHRANRDIGDSELNLEGYELFRKDRDIKNEKGNDQKNVIVF